MTRPLLSEAEDVLALPAFPIAIQGRPTQGVLWNPRREEVVIESLHAISHPPRPDDVRMDLDALGSSVRTLGDRLAAVESTVIFGGYLLRHFGHFLHESLSRLWWLGQGTIDDPLISGLRNRLQAEKGEVVFFMPRWLDDGKDLPTYMADVLGGLGLPPGRIRILVDPTQLRRVLIPAQCWGFNFDEPAWNDHLGCDCRQLMRALLGSHAIPTAAVDDGPLPPDRIYITRTGLPLQLGRLIGDGLLDHLMEAAGYGIFHPERHPIAEQIRLYSQARELVFMDSSALYLLWFCHLRTGVRIRVILRRRQGAWMCDQVHRLLPPTEALRWQVLNALRAESLTSRNDWESHNLADIPELAHALAPAITLPGERVQGALVACTEELLDQLDREQLSGLLQALLQPLIQPEWAPPGHAPSRLKARAQRWWRRLRRLAGGMRRRLTSP